MAFIPNQGFEVSVSGTASTALNIFENAKNTPSQLQVILYSTVDCYVKLSTSSVVADNTITSEKAAAGNSFLPAGAVMLYGLANDQTYISSIAADGVSTGTLYITRGLGEEV